MIYSTKIQSIIAFSFSNDNNERNCKNNKGDELSSANISTDSLSSLQSTSSSGSESSRNQNYCRTVSENKGKCELMLAIIFWYFWGGLCSKSRASMFFCPFCRQNLDLLALLKSFGSFISNLSENNTIQ